MSDLPMLHPDRSQLAAFTDGTLSELECGRVEEHLAACPSCLSTLESLPDDPLACLIRGAAVRGTAAAHSTVDAGGVSLPPGPTSFPTGASPRLQLGYEIIEKIGQGGMGVVYKTRQAGLNRFVALKKIHAGSHAGPEALARFRREAEAVAKLDHPNIVRIHEIGEQDGQPYLALEFLDGGNLADRLKEPLPPRIAAELVQTLARAIDHAHQRGIVHRDLKPANVMLQMLQKDETGRMKDEKATKPDSSFILPISSFRLKITDFGLAKDLSNELGRTQTGAILGTPSYMSPEQASGSVHEVGPAADIYALGAILYECLTGRPPFQGATPLDTLHLVRHQEPVPPTRLQPLVPRELETICLKCLSKEPPQRYATAGLLAEDLRRFLVGEAILARPTPYWRKAWIWARRRPMSAALILVSTAALLTLVIGGSVMNARLSASLRRESREKTRAEANTRRAVSAFRRAIREEAAVNLDDVPEMEGVRKALLADGVKLFEDLLQDEESPDPRTRFNRAEMLVSLGEVEGILGHLDRAESSFQLAKQHFEALVKEFPDEPKYRSQLAQVAERYGMNSQQQGKTRHAEAAYREALDLYQETRPRRPDDDNGLASVYANLAILLTELGRSQEAEACLTRAVTLRRELCRAQPDNVDYRATLARNCQSEALAHLWAGRFPQAEIGFREAIDILEPLAEGGRDSRKHQDSLAETYSGIAQVCETTSRLDEAKRYHDKSIALRTQLARQFPRSVPRQQALERSLNNLTGVFLGLNRPADAEAPLKQALAIDRRLCDEFPKDGRHQFNYAAALSNLGLIYASTQRLGEARKAYEQSASLLDSLNRQDPAAVHLAQAASSAHLNLGELHRTESRFADAVAHQDRAIALVEGVLRKTPENHGAKVNLLNASGSRALALQKLGRNAEAVADWDRVVELAQGTNRIRYRHMRAAALTSAGDHARAAAEAKALAATPGETPDNLYDLACIYAQAIPAAEKDHKLDQPRRSKVVEQYADASLALLRQLYATAYFNAPASRARLQKDDPDFEPLRNRSDFKKLLAEILSAPEK